MELIKRFLKNLKEYVNYLMKVDFKELFANTIIILCIALLSALVYAPVGIVEGILRDLLSMFMTFGGIFALLYSWVFTLLSAVCCLGAFMYMFNKRFDDLDELKKQIGNSYKKDDKDKKVNKNDDLDLPKSKK